MSQSIYDHEVVSLDGSKISLSDYKNQVLLIVNTASECGFTPQYDGLEKIYQQYKEQGFSVLGFPCNQFGKQEPGDNSEIANFCTTRFSVTFPMFEKIEVNGEKTHPLFEQLKAEAPGILGSKRIKWNFTKFLINRNGEVIKRFAPKDKPENLTSHIEALL